MKKPFYVKIIKEPRGRPISDIFGLPVGSVIEVQKEYKNSYRGLWSSAGGSYMVTVGKEYVRKI